MPIVMMLPFEHTSLVPVLEEELISNVWPTEDGANISHVINTVHTDIHIYLYI